MDIDDTDRALVDALLEDGRASARTLAAETGVVAESAERRIEALEEAGVIEGYTAIVDYGELGYDVTALVRLRVDGPIEAVGDALGECPWARSVYEVTGEDDFLMVGTFRDTDDMHGNVAELLTRDAVRSISIDVVLNAVRDDAPIRLRSTED